MRGVRQNAVYMEITMDELELPVAFADSPRELARICGVSAHAVTAAVERSFNTKRKTDKRERFIRVPLDE